MQIFLVVASFTKILGRAFPRKSTMSHDLSFSPSLRRHDGLSTLIHFDAGKMANQKSLERCEHEVKQFLHFDRHVYHLSQ